MIDTHAHLNSPEFVQNIDQIVSESKQVGVTSIIIASSNLVDSFASVELAQKYPNYLYASVGIHPQQTDPDTCDSVDIQLSILDKLITDRRSLITAVGECGLDYSPAPPGEQDRTRDDQELLFRGQIDLSIKHGLPLIIHARQANTEVIRILSDYPKSCGVFHCYSGGKKRVNKIIELPNKWYFGFDGNLTYDSGLQAVVKEIPVNRILIETDTPFLAPAPFRNYQNKPAYLPYIQKQLNTLFHKDITNTVITNSKTIFTI